MKNQKWLKQKQKSKDNEKTTDMSQQNNSQNLDLSKTFERLLNEDKKDNSFIELTSSLNESLNSLSKTNNSLDELDSSLNEVDGSLNEGNSSFIKSDTSLNVEEDYENISSGSLGEGEDLDDINSKRIDVLFDEIVEGLKSQRQLKRMKKQKLRSEKRENRLALRTTKRLKKEEEKAKRNEQKQVLLAEKQQKIADKKQLKIEKQAEKERCKQAKIQTRQLLKFEKEQEKLNRKLQKDMKYASSVLGTLSQDKDSELNINNQTLNSIYDNTYFEKNTNSSSKNCQEDFEKGNINSNKSYQDDKDFTNSQRVYGSESYSRFEPILNENKRRKPRVKSKSVKKGLFGISALMILAILLGGGYFLYQGGYIFNVDVVRQPLAIIYQDGHVNGTTINAVVGNDVNFVNLNNKITIHKNSKYEVFLDDRLEVPLDGNIVNLECGDNHFYIRVKTALNENKVYFLSIRRKPLYTIDFSFNGETIKSVTVEEGNKLKLLLPPEKVGHNFIGWYNGDTKFDSTMDINENYSLSAQFEAKTYKIELVLKEGQPENKTIYVKYGQSFVLETPIGDEQNSFFGWFYGDTKITNGLWFIDSDVTLHAKWSSKVFLTDKNKITGLTEYGKSLNKLIIPMENKNFPITEITANCFMNMTHINQITLPSNLTTIGEFAFFNCQSLAVINLNANNSLKNIGGYAFFNTAWISKQSSDAVYLGKVLYTYRGSQTELTFGEETASIASFAFNNNNLITSITFTSHIDTIGEGAFYNCQNLTHISFASSPDNVGKEAFLNTAWLSLQPDGVVYLGDKVLTFKGNIWKEDTVTIKEGTTEIYDYAFYLINGLGQIELPESLMKIGKYAFFGTSINQINLKNTAVIGEGAFSDCEYLIEVAGKGEITLILPYTFNHCRSLKAIELPFVEEIHSYAFSHCENLIGVVTGENLIFIGDYAFSHCINLESMMVKNDECVVSSLAFYNCNSLSLSVNN